jgi:hypothetical protein
MKFIAMMATFAFCSTLIGAVAYKLAISWNADPALCDHIEAHYSSLEPEPLEVVKQWRQEHCR